MILKAIIGDHTYDLKVPDALIVQAQPFFDQLDRDMGRGWQMSREWVDQPDPLQRCQIVADKLLTALEAENEKLGLLMAGYLLARLPGLGTVELDVRGEIQNIRFQLATSAEPLVAADAPPPVQQQARSRRMSKLEAMEQAGQEITQVFRVGRGYRFSVLDAPSGTWHDAPLAATEAEAGRLRQQAFKARYEALMGGDRNG